MIRKLHTALLCFYGAGYTSVALLVSKEDPVLIGLLVVIMQTAMIDIAHDNMKMKGR